MVIRARKRLADGESARMRFEGDREAYLMQEG
jgi:hypothetical protein